MPALADDTILDLVELVSDAARSLGIETALIGAVAVAAYGYVRGTADADLGTNVADPRAELSRLRDVLAARGLHVELRLPDDVDPLGGVLRIWQHEDEEGDPVEPVDVVNFHNPHRPGRRHPGNEAIREAVPVDGSALRCVRLSHLIALKLAAGSQRDRVDVVELLDRNRNADVAEIESVCKAYGLDAELREILDKLRAETR